MKILEKIDNYLDESQLVIDYPTAKKLGVDKKIEKWYMEMPLSDEEKKENIDDWKKKASTSLVIMSSKHASEIKKIRSQMSND